LGSWFDVKLDKNGMQSHSWEHDEQSLFNQSANLALQKSGISPKQVDLLIGGDLNAQLSGFYFGLRDLPTPSLGIYSACSSSTEALALAGLALDSGMAHYVLAGTSSHNSTAERQFRSPTEYGVQRPSTAQRTVTGAGMAPLGKTGSNIALTTATIGRVVDYGVTNPWEFGAAMAPAAADTLTAHLQDTGHSLEDYDCIATGDLGHIGHKILRDLLSEQGLDPGGRLTDCGILIYRPDQPEVFSGGSGAACSTLVTFAYLLHQLQSGRWRRLLVAATGALLSTVAAQQGETIPSICHAVTFERKDASA
jgi:stage V sporulation protein AD